MSRPPSPSERPPATCAACGQAVNSRFCVACGAPREPGTCLACHATLSPGARYCHRCGTLARPPMGGLGGRGLKAFIVAGGAVVLMVLLAVWRLGGASPTVPDMGNAGNAGAQGTVAPLSGRAPDISNLSPRERFDRLYDRVMSAAERGDTVTVAQFIPMALDSYSMLDSVNADARYHAGMLNIVDGDFARAAALADTILRNAPGHLFGYLVRGEAADRANQPAALTAAYQEFLDHFDAELRAGRSEYQEHRSALDNFRTRARASLGR